MCKFRRNYPPGVTSSQESPILVRAARGTRTGDRSTSSVTRLGNLLPGSLRSLSALRAVRGPEIDRRRRLQRAYKLFGDGPRIRAALGDSLGDLAKASALFEGTRCAIREQR